MVYSVDLILTDYIGDVVVKHVFKLSMVSAGILASSAVLAVSPNNAQIQREIQQINARDQQLQQEVHVLKAQLHHQSNGLSVQRPAVSHTLKTTNRGRHVQTSRFNRGLDVTTSPLQGGKAAFDASDLLDQVSKWNEQLTLLQQRSALAATLGKGGLSITRPIVEVSGGVEGQMFYTDGYGKGSTPNGIALDKAELDINAITGNWANAFFALNYEDSPRSQGFRGTTGSLDLDRGFLTIGNLNKLPVYFSIGKMYAPFGRYSSFLLSTPTTQSLGRIQSDTALVGVASHGFYGSAFAYDGSRTSGSANLFEQGGFDAGYTFKFSNPANSLNVGVSMVSNLADSQGLQDTGAYSSSQFQGFGQTGSSNNIAHDVPAFDVYTGLSYDNWGFNAEFVTAVRRFSASDLAFGSTGATLHGALPRALHAEGSYTFHAGPRPLMLGVGYDHTWEALAANLPQNSIETVFQTSVWKDTIEAIEYRHDIDYGTGKSASGRGSSSLAGTGNGRNMVIGQIGVYF